MNQLRIILLAVLVVNCSWLRAEVIADSTVVAASVQAAEIRLIPLEPANAYWLFTGVVNSEAGDRYAYVFQLEKKDQELRLQSALFDEHLKERIFFYEASAKVQEEPELKWKIGRAFLNHNLITDSWTFGVKTKEGKGFNFKIDMLKQEADQKDIHALRKGLMYWVRETTQLNGHLQGVSAEAEQFVTADKSWFVKSWLSQEQKDSHLVEGIFCRMNDKSRFYSINLREEDAKRATMAAWFDPQGNEVKMSQFMMIANKDNKEFTVRLSLPKVKLSWMNLLTAESSTMMAGFFYEDQKGFCLIADQNYQALTVEPAAVENKS